MPCKCVECGGKTDCDSIICTECLAEIIDRVNQKNGGKNVAAKSPDKIELTYGQV